MVALLVVLLATNAVTIAAVLWLWHARSSAGRRPDSAADQAIAEMLTEVARRPATGGTRRVISVEILNPIELAAARGRVIGLAGSLAPGFVARVVHEQAIRTLRQQLVEQHVAAEVRLHTLRPEAGATVRSAATDQVDGFEETTRSLRVEPDSDGFG